MSTEKNFIVVGPASLLDAIQEQLVADGALRMPQIPAKEWRVEALHFDFSYGDICITHSGDTHARNAAKDRDLLQ